MASLQERRRADGSIAYRVLYRHNGKQRAETFETPDAQRRFKADIDRLGIDAALKILDAHSGNAAAGIPTLTEQIEHHINVLSGITDGTRADYRRMAALVAATPLGRLPIDAITKADIARWIADQEQAKVAGKTIRNRLVLVSAALARAVDDELIAHNRARKARIGRTITEEMVILTPDEFTRLVSAAHEHYRPMLWFLYTTGARLSEATALRVGDITTGDNPTVSIVRAWKRTGVGAGVELGAPKSRKSRRTITLPMSVVAMLDLERPADALLFLNLAGEPIKRSTFGRSWRLWVERANLGKSPRTHDLRHSHASLLIGNGVNPLTVQHRLGHEDIRTTLNTYGHLLPDAQVQAVRLTEAMLPQIGR